MNFLRKALLDESVLLDLDAADLGTIFERTLDHIVFRGLLKADGSSACRRSVAGTRGTSLHGHRACCGGSSCLSRRFAEPVIVFIRLKHPLNLGAPDGIPTRFLFVLLGPKEAAAEHLETLTNIARLMSDHNFRFDAAIAHDQPDLLTALKHFERRTSKVPVAEAVISEGLRYSGTLFGGLVQDFRRRMPHYRSDFVDGLHPKCLSSTLFLFFACLAPAVTFGGIMAELTGNHIGAVEMILGTAICGIVYALFSGQPLIILGGTGPLLIFTMILYQLCSPEHLDLPFLETRAWVGLWTAFLLLVLAATDASCLMRFFTRFTDEIFAALISIIFIYAAIDALVKIFQNLEVTKHHATAILSLLLALGTLYVANSLAQLRRSRYLVPWMREFLSDFGPTIAIAAMTLVAIWLQDVDLKQLPTPDSFRPTIDRSWLVDLSAVETWVWFASLGPAILVTVLVYVDQNITARLVNSPDHKL